MPLIKGTETEKNVMISFAYESTARNRYTFYSIHARKQGDIEAAAVFELTAEQERMHGEKFYELLEGGVLQVEGRYFIAGEAGSTEQNLGYAAQQEMIEYTGIYPSFAQKADEEGFPAIADLYRQIMIAEEAHKKRFDYFLKFFRDRSLYERSEETLWQCQKCGYTQAGRLAPDICPLCLQRRGWFYAVNPKID